jgi:hypothetical protein
VSELWLPGAAAPLDELVSRIHLRIEAFATEAGKQPRVDVDLRDGATVAVQSLSAEPGFGFVTLRPHAGEDVPEELIVPVASIRRLELRRTEEAPGRLGFQLPG